MTTPTIGFGTSDLDIFVPMLPQSTNAKLYWAARKRESYRICSAIASLVAINFPGWKNLGLEKATIAITREMAGSTKRMDNDNLAGSYKGVIDGLRAATPAEDASSLREYMRGKQVYLVRLGIIKDDTPDHVHITYAQQRSARNGTRIQIRRT